MSALQWLRLDGNELTGPIPTTIGRLKHLEILVLSDNKLQESIPEALCQAQLLGRILLSNNRLNGSIPDCIGTELKSLEILFMGSNKLTSAIPLTLWSLNHLFALGLDSNMLNGSLSLDIGNLKQLVELDLSHNQLGGEIPSTIGGAIMLTQLSLAHNNLHGSIPSAISKLISLENLDLSSNNLSGVIPMSMEALKNLNYINVSINKLHGEIPTGGCFANFTSESFVENDGFCGASRLQVPSCRNATPRRSMSRTVLLFICIIPIIVLVILVCVAILFFKRRQAKNFNAPAQTDLVPPSLRKVTYFELVRATDSFSESNLLGSGSFGFVYIGVLLNGMNVAVKVFNMHLERTLKSFTVECEVLRMVRHRNLVGIISSCTNLDFMALVLEYMPCGSLEKWLYSHNYCLDISQRLNIMIDVASALEYLHHGQTTPIVHCDLKPSNVLLDEDMVAHVSDFGISKLLGEDKFVSHTNTLATVGYMAPEYGSEGIVSTKGDVYSYGILLMETFTRKRPTDETFSSEMSLRSWVSSALHDSLLSAVVDTNLLSNEDEQHLPAATKQCVSSIFQLALDCSINSHVERIISMVDVVVRLEKIKIAFYASNTRAPTRR